MSAKKQNDENVLWLLNEGIHDPDDRENTKIDLSTIGEPKDFIETMLGRLKDVDTAIKVAIWYKHRFEDMCSKCNELIDKNQKNYNIINAIRESLDSANPGLELYDKPQGE